MSSTFELHFRNDRIESRFVIRSRMVRLRRHGRATALDRAARARDRDAVLGLRQLGHALPRLPLARRRAHRAGAHRRRGARAPAHGLLPDASRSTSRGTRSTTTASCAASRRSRASASARSTRTSSATTSTASAASAIPTPGVRAHALDHCRECVEIAERGRLDDRSASGSPTARTTRARTTCAAATRAWSTGSRSSTPRCPPGMRLLVEYKFFEPGFYSTDLPDWGTAALALPPARPAGAGARRHRPPPAGDERRADRRAAARGGPARRLPLQQPQVRGRRPDRRLDRPVRALPDHARDRARRRRDEAIAFMIDQSHNVEGKIDAMIQSVMNIQTAYAKALLVDEDALAAAQAEGDVLGAHRVLLEAFETDVRPLLARLRAELGVDAGPGGGIPPRRLRRAARAGARHGVGRERRTSGCDARRRDRRGRARRQRDPAEPPGRRAATRRDLCAASRSRGGGRPALRRGARLRRCRPHARGVRARRRGSRRAAGPVPRRDLGVHRAGRAGVHREAGGERRRRGAAAGRRRRGRRRARRRRLHEALRRRLPARARRDAGGRSSARRRSGRSRGRWGRSRTASTCATGCSRTRCTTSTSRASSSASWATCRSCAATRQRVHRRRDGAGGRAARSSASARTPPAAGSSATRRSRSSARDTPCSSTTWTRARGGRPSVPSGSGGRTTRSRCPRT